MQILFAPLQGYTDFDFRNTHNAVYGHIDAYYTPFVRLESGGTFRPKDIKVTPRSTSTWAARTA